MALSDRSRRAITTALAILLAVETVTAVAAAAATRTVTHPLPAEPPAGAVLAIDATPAPALPSTPAGIAASIAIPDQPDFTKPVTVRPASPAPAPSRAKNPATAERGDRLASARAATGARAGSGATAAGSTAYRGRNHVWIPELGINRSVAWFPCERQRPPDNLVYRWGCAGNNNVYLMGHAYSVMRPLHDAYVSGRLHKGMKAWYADGNGRVRVYAVKWWKVTLPTPDAEWAWAPQATPSMTLQTCVGKNSRYRLMVRLVEVGG